MDELDFVNAGILLAQLWNIILIENLVMAHANYLGAESQVYDLGLLALHYHNK